MGVAVYRPEELFRDYHYALGEDDEQERLAETLVTRILSDEEWRRVIIHEIAALGLDEFDTGYDFEMSQLESRVRRLSLFDLAQRELSARDFLIRHPQAARRLLKRRLRMLWEQADRSPLRLSAAEADALLEKALELCGELNDCTRPLASVEGAALAVAICESLLARRSGDAARKFADLPPAHRYYVLRDTPSEPAGVEPLATALLNRCLEGEQVDEAIGNVLPDLPPAAGLDALGVRALVDALSASGVVLLDSRNAVNSKLIELAATCAGEDYRRRGCRYLRGFFNDAARLEGDIPGYLTQLVAGLEGRRTSVAAEYGYLAAAADQGSIEFPLDEHKAVFTRDGDKVTVEASDLGPETTWRFSLQSGDDVWSGELSTSQPRCELQHAQRRFPGLKSFPLGFLARVRRAEGE